jgi:hypothetical protein
MKTARWHRRSRQAVFYGAISGILRGLQVKIRLNPDASGVLVKESPSLLRKVIKRIMKRREGSAIQWAAKTFPMAGRSTGARVEYGALVGIIY